MVMITAEADSNPALPWNTPPVLAFPSKSSIPPPAPMLNFPVDWKQDGLFEWYTGDAENQAGNSLFVPSVAARQDLGGTEVDGVTVVGPIIWRPPAPESAIAEDHRRPSASSSTRWAARARSSGAGRATMEMPALLTPAT